MSFSVFSRRRYWRMSSMTIACAVAVTAPATIALAQAAERQAPVEVTVPKAPEPVVGAGSRLLVYEMHVTNFGARPMTLRSVEVFAGLSETPLATLRDSTLRDAIQPVGPMAMMQPAGGMSDKPLQLDPGKRAVVFMWLAFAPTQPLPTSLRHRLTFSRFDTTAQGVSAHSPVIDGIVTPVMPGTEMSIAPPIRGGDWLAGNGPSNDSPHRRTLVPVNGTAWLSQRFAIDFVKIGSNGNTWHGDRSRNENFWGYGEPIVAVASGEVVSVVDSIPENVPDHLPVSTLATVSGNHIILRVAPQRYVMYAHLQRGTIRVHQGQRVKTGDVLALLGNSGQATAPHLHFQMMDRPSDLAAEGMPFVFDHYDDLGPGSAYEYDKHPTVPTRRQLPIGDAVVRLPPA
jgi:murein DD-endopeptidase